MKRWVWLQACNWRITPGSMSWLDGSHQLEMRETNPESIQNSSAVPQVKKMKDEEWISVKPLHTHTHTHMRTHTCIQAITVSCTHKPPHKVTGMWLTNSIVCLWFDCKVHNQNNINGFILTNKGGIQLFTLQLLCPLNQWQFSLHKVIYPVLGKKYRYILKL